MLRDYVLLGVFFVSLFSVSFSFYNRAALHKERAEVLQKMKEDIEGKFKVFTGIYEKNQQQTKELMNAQQSISSHLITQQRETQRLQNEVQEIKEWADNVLPADIARLRQRPAFTGANAYSERLFSGDSLRIELQ